MARFLKNRDISYGSVPGSMVFIGKKKVDKTIISLISYDKDNLYEEKAEEISVLSNRKSDMVNWVLVKGVHNSKKLSELFRFYNIPDIISEDVQNTDNRPKVVVEKDYILIIIKTVDLVKGKISSDQITLLLKGNDVVTLMEKDEKVLKKVEERVRNSNGRIRGCSSSYLLYALLDGIADNYFTIIEKVGAMIENFEKRIVSTDKKLLEELYIAKTELMYLKKNIYPAKEITLRLTKKDLIQDVIEYNSYYTDLDELLTHSQESLNSYFEMINDQLASHQTFLSSRVNDIMKFLTIFSSVFIPLTFIAGIYGTNFEYLPELHLRFGYFLMLGVMLIIALLMLWIFRKKGWL
ncbi:MAG: magnesium/cobalt transporter CorA [Candidatus Delongbacteria bacterium]|nr:magnesium/cobalt transporter CorA [Candidatus Delongbacteria bacterium]MBN2836038.1 magnesium/cobalt transporter CorA [Candidatus Delongbacteria bacterium]